MKILSFDIGIKNLAYCVIDGDNLEILDWGILDLRTGKSCDHITKGSKSCDKEATSIVDGHYLCTTHKKLAKYKSLKSKRVPKQDNPMLTLGKRLVEVLDSHDLFLNVDAVLLENQPALKNPTMKSVQMMIYSFFLIKGIANESSDIKTIVMINARNKLKAYQGSPISCDIKDKYKRTKYLGIKYCELMIHANQEIDEKFHTLFETNKKKDDLADAYLQAIYYMTK
tara:strand:+ start:194 stop:871 length:678 start_codon:yes stop_codon:yes gene_type:complete